MRWEHDGAVLEALAPSLLFEEPTIDRDDRMEEVIDQEVQAPIERPVPGRSQLAVFCFEAPDSPIGRYVEGAVTALAATHQIHLFSRLPFDLPVLGLVEHTVGECPEGDPIERVDEYTREACNRFLHRFPGGDSAITLLGYDWSAAQALAMLKGLKGLPTVLSLHSLERQRSDMTSEVSEKIWQIELEALRVSTSIVIHDPATAEIARSWLPDCQARLVMADQPFWTEPFQGLTDAGAVKARYQVGPVDPTIVFVGDLSEGYGPDLLVKAMPAILKNHPQARLVVAGYGELLWPLKVYSRYLLLDHAVRMVGSVEGEELCELIQAADVVVVPSRTSTPWWPIQAAWAAGTPVVTTHEAASDLTEHGEDSVLCYPAENSCVWGIEQVLFDEELQQRIIRRGREKLATRFGWNIVAGQLTGLIGSLRGN